MSSPNDVLIDDSILAATQVDRIAVFSDNQFVFDFNNLTNAIPGEDGILVPGVNVNFPAIMTGKGAMVVGALGPCGLNPPHTHPRATEIQVVVSGGPIKSAMVMEDGARVVQNTIELGSATVYPEGSIHFQQNLGCKPTVFVASFDNPDPGTDTIANLFFGLDKGVVSATLTDLGVTYMENLVLPSSIIKGTQDCFDRCNINRDSFNFTAAYPGFKPFQDTNWTVPSPPPASASSSSMSKKAGLLATNAQGSANNVPFSQNPLKDVVIGLSTISAMLLIASLGMLIMLRMHRRTPKRMYAPPPISTYGYTNPYDDTERLTDIRSSMHTPEKS